MKVPSGQRVRNINGTGCFAQDKNLFCRKIAELRAGFCVRGAGIAFAPMKGTSKGGNTQWRKYTGVGYAGYGSSGGVVTTYRLGARMDDSLTGITHAEGYWNADYVTW